MVDIRTVTLPALWADDAITEIPTPPIANTTYRNTDLGSTELLAGWPYQKIVDSADFNQTLWLISNLVKSCEQYGIMPWCASTTYKQNGICLASNGIFYWAKKENTGVNPVNDSGMTNWGVFLDPGDNFVTETVLTSQINLCEKLANKTQTLSSSSTTTQYPSAKAVYDNINNLQNSKQNNITGGASSITTNNLTANRALLSDGNGKVAVSAVTNTELGYLDGVTSNIQNQLNGKQATGSYVTTNTKQVITADKTFHVINIKSPDSSYTNNGFIYQSKSKGDITIGIRIANLSTFLSTLDFTPSGKIRFYIDSSATERYIEGITPPNASDNSIKIPTTVWVNNRITSIMNSNAVGFPDYEAGIQITETNYTAPQNGVICGSLSTPENSNKYYFYINDVKVAFSMGKDGRSNGDSNISVIVKSGDVFTFDPGASLDNVFFFPFIS